MINVSRPKIIALYLVVLTVISVIAAFVVVFVAENFISNEIIQWLYGPSGVSWRKSFLVIFIVGGLTGTLTVKEK